MRSMDQVAVQPFVAVARARGMSETCVLWRHVMGNALLPALNIAGLLLGELIAGALITETVFGRSGLGQLTQQAVNNQDIAVLQAVVMISALGFVLINLLVDLVMPRLDPPTPFTDRRCEMSLVDYTIAVRRRPEWRRVRLQPGLWLAWAVMIAALLMAIAPQWFTSANPLEGIPGAQRLAPQAHYWLGTDQLGRDLWTRVVYGAVHSPVGGADRRRHRPGGGHRPWHPRRGAGRTRGIHHHAPGRCPAGHPLPCCCSSR